MMSDQNQADPAPIRERAGEPNEVAKLIADYIDDLVGIATGQGFERDLADYWNTMAKIRTLRDHVASLTDARAAAPTPRLICESCRYSPPLDKATLGGACANCVYGHYRLMVSWPDDRAAATSAEPMATDAEMEALLQSIDRLPQLYQFGGRTMSLGLIVRLLRPAPQVAALSQLAEQRETLRGFAQRYGDDMRAQLEQEEAKVAALREERDALKAKLEAARGIADA